MRTNENKSVLQLGLKTISRKSICYNSMHYILLFVTVLLSFTLYSCHYVRPNFEKMELSEKTKDSLSYLYNYHYTLNTNFEVVSDSINLALLPVKDKFVTVHKDDRVVVAEFMIQPADSVDSVWVKVARDQETQGWIHQSEVVKHFVPVDSISQFIYLFSHTHASYSLALVALVLIIFIFRIYRKKRLRLVYFNDINSVYPLLLCFLLAFSATTYETIQVFAAEAWKHYYFNPTLSPFKVPMILSVFLLSVWAFIIVFLASLEDLYRQLTFSAAFFYLVGLGACCIFCYFFFIYATAFYIGYPVLLLFFIILVKKINGRMRYKYRCGKCGALMAEKGKCGVCGAINE